MNANFIKLRTIKSVWDGSNYNNVVGMNLIVRLDTITQISELVNRVVYPDDDTRRKMMYNTKDSHPMMNIAYIATSILEGKGINGVSSSLTIDEESYNRLLEALDLD